MVVATAGIVWVINHIKGGADVSKNYCPAIKPGISDKGKNPMNDETTEERPKDPIKVRAGTLGGKRSGGNFKRNKALATYAGKMSAWKRAGSRLEDKPLPYEALTGDPNQEIA